MKGPIFKTAISNIVIGWKRIYSDKLLRMFLGKLLNLLDLVSRGYWVLAGADTGYGAAFGFGYSSLQGNWHRHRSAYR